MTERDDLSAERSYKLANVWRLRGKTALAMKGYSEALQVCPSHLDACLELAELWEGKGAINKAIEICQTTLRQRPESDRLQERIGELKERLDRESVRCSGPRTGRNKVRPGAADPANSGAAHIVFYTDCSGIYGAEKYNHLLMCEMTRWGYRVTCAQPEASHDLIDERCQIGITHHWLRENSLYDRKLSAAAMRDISEARSILEAVQPDLIFFGDGCPVSNLGAKMEAARQEIPYLMLNHCVSSEWAGKFNDLLGELPSIYGHAAGVVAVSRQNLDLLHQLFGLPENKGLVIYSGVPSDFFAEPQKSVRACLREELGLSEDTVVCLTAARMEIMKGYQYLLEALKILQTREVWGKLHFVWLGTGTLEHRLRSWAEKMDLKKRVSFLGQRSDVADWLDMADIYILPSQFEGLPVSVLEAMAKGLPVLATAVSGTPEALGDTGRLLPDPNCDRQALIEALASTIESVALNPELRREAGELCRKRAQQLFTEERMLLEYKGMLEKVLAKISPQHGVR